MTESFRLGRIAGVRVGAHWSVLAVLALIATGLAAGRLPLVAPGRSGIAYAAAGLGTGLRPHNYPAARRSVPPPSEIPVARPDEPLTDLLPRMAGCSDGRAVVLDTTGRLVGIVSPSDVARTVQNAELRSRADAIPH